MAMADPRGARDAPGVQILPFSAKKLQNYLTFGVAPLPRNILDPTLGGLCSIGGNNTQHSVSVNMFVNSGGSRISQTGQGRQPLSLGQGRQPLS